MSKNDKKQIRYTQIKSTDNEYGKENGLKDGKDFESGEIHFNDISTPSPPAATDNEKSCVWNVLLLLCYFVLSIGLTFYQRWLLKGYKFPISVVIYHLIVKLLISSLLRYLYRVCTGKRRVEIPLSTVARKIAPTSFFGALDIGLSQWGLEFVHIALYTMTKSTVIIFITFFAILFKLEKKSISLLMIVVMISSGLFLFTYKSTEFHLLGFILLIIASISSGARWTLAQLLMQKSKLNLHNPIDMIYFMQPYMILSLLPFALLFEGGRIVTLIPSIFDLEFGEFLIIWVKVSVGAFLAFFLETSEFLVLRLTSSLTLSIAGIFKELIQLTLAVIINNEILSLYNDIGLVLCLGGIIMHVVHKYCLAESDKKKFDDLDDANFQLDLQNSPFKSSKVKDARVTMWSNHKTPLLDSSDESSDNETEHKSSEIIFDILQRRENVIKN